MNKKVAISIVAIALVVGGGLWAYSYYSSHSSPTSPSSSTPTSSSEGLVDQTQDEVDQQVEAEESGFTKEVNKYLSDNKITEPITSETGLHSLYMYLHDARQIDPTLLTGETNEYFPGYLEWYNAEGWKVDIGPQTDPAPAPVPAAPGEAGKQPDGSIILEDGMELTPEEAKGVYVPKDQILTYVQTNYGKDALATLSELVSRDKGYLDGLQFDLAKHPAEEFKNLDLPLYEDILAGLKIVEADKENFKNNYDPNKSVYNNG